MRPGTWTIRLNPEATPNEFESLAALLSDELRSGLITALSSAVLAALEGGTSLCSDTFPVTVDNGPHLHFRVRFAQELGKNGAVDNVFGPRGAPIGFSATGIKTEARWLASDDPGRMLTGRWHILSPRKRRLFGCACCRFTWVSLTDERSRAAVEVAELFADGLTDDARLTAAHDAANAVVREMPGELKSSSACLACCAAASAANPMNACIAVSNALIEAAQGDAITAETRVLHGALLRDLAGNPFRRVHFDPLWRTDTAVALARQMYEARDFSALPILADALQDASCDSTEVLDHCRGTGPHARGCWVVDSVLGRE